jgi:hypothetical protein
VGRLQRDSGLQRDLVRRAREGEFVRCDVKFYGHAAGEETIVIDSRALSKASSDEFGERGRERLCRISGSRSVTQLVDLKAFDF